MWTQIVSVVTCSRKPCRHIVKVLRIFFAVGNMKESFKIHVFAAPVKKNKQYPLFPSNLLHNMYISIMNLLFVDKEHWNCWYWRLYLVKQATLKECVHFCFSLVNATRLLLNCDKNVKALILAQPLNYPH